MRRDGCEPSILAHAHSGWIFLRDDEGNVIEFQVEGIDGLLDEIAIAIAYVLKLGRGNAHEKHPAIDVAEARRF